MEPYYRVALRTRLEGLRDGIIEESQENNLASGSCIRWSQGSLVQDLSLRLENLEAQVDLQLEWTDEPPPMEAATSFKKLVIAQCHRKFRKLLSGGWSIIN